jgi:hypothetical protein
MHYSKNLFKKERKKRIIYSIHCCREMMMNDESKREANYTRYNKKE